MLVGTGEKYIPYNPDLKARSREMRKEMTQAEQKLWFGYLRKHKLNFARQKPINHFIVDFYCPSAKLVIEVDGEPHFSEQGKAYDSERTAILETYGLKVIRFSNQEVLQNLDSVIKKIEAELVC